MVIHGHYQTVMAQDTLAKATVVLHQLGIILLRVTMAKTAFITVLTSGVVHTIQLRLLPTVILYSEDVDRVWATLLLLTTVMAGKLGILTRLLLKAKFTDTAEYDF